MDHIIDEIKDEVVEINKKLDALMSNEPTTLESTVDSSETILEQMDNLNHRLDIIMVKLGIVAAPKAAYADIESYCHDS